MKPARRKKRILAQAAYQEHRAAKRSKYAAKKWQQKTGKKPQPKTKGQRRGAKR